MQYDPSRPLKVGGEHHDALQGPRGVLASDRDQLPALPCLDCREAWWGSQAFPVSEAQWLKPLGAGGSATRSQACSSSRQGPGRALWPASVRFCSEEVPEAKRLRALFLRACPDPVSPGG